MILCVAGDPGGSRAVLPVARELFSMGKNVRIPCHGFLARELPPEMEGCLCEENAAVALLEQADAVVFGSSTNDSYPLSLARAAAARGVYVMHVLDNWSNYLARLTTDGAPPLFPDIYCVMDEQARQCALTEGIPPDRLAVLGQPSLCDAANAIDALMRQKEAPHSDGPLRVAFICEPFSMVYGRDCTSPGHPGFTEETVLAALAAALSPHAARMEIILLAHPKQDPAAVADYWDAVRGPLRGNVIKLKRGEEILGMVRGVTGMASILLYEAWLAGLPVLCMQPACRMAAMRRFGTLEGVCYTDAASEIPDAARQWLTRMQQPPAARKELLLHKNAPRRVADFLLRHIQEHS